MEHGAYNGHLEVNPTWNPASHHFKLHSLCSSINNDLMAPFQKFSVLENFPYRLLVSSFILQGVSDDIVDLVFGPSGMY